MRWTSTTPLYLPLIYPDSLLAGCHRLARDVATRWGAAPPLRPQPAPLGQPAVLIGPDPAYTGGIAPTAPGTFTAVTSGPELIVTGADPLGTNLGLGWLARAVLGLTVDGRVPAARADQSTAERPGPDGLELSLDLRLPPWPTGPRGWRVASALDDDGAWDLCEAVYRAGGDTVAATGRTAAVAATAGLQVLEPDSPAAALLPLWNPVGTGRTMASRQAGVARVGRAGGAPGGSAAGVGGGVGDWWPEACRQARARLDCHPKGLDDG